MVSIKMTRVKYQFKGISSTLKHQRIIIECSKEQESEGAA